MLHITHIANRLAQLLLSFLFLFLVMEDICIKTKSIYYKKPLQSPGCKADPPQAVDGQTK